MVLVGFFALSGACCYAWIWRFRQVLRGLCLLECGPFQLPCGPCTGVAFSVFHPTGYRADSVPGSTTLQILDPAGFFGHLRISDNVHLALPPILYMGDRSLLLQVLPEFFGKPEGIAGPGMVISSSRQARCGGSIVVSVPFDACMESAVEQRAKLLLLLRAGVGPSRVYPAGDRAEAAPGVLPFDVLHAALLLGDLIVSGVIHEFFPLSCASTLYMVAALLFLQVFSFFFSKVASMIYDQLIRTFFRSFAHAVDCASALTMFK